MVAHHATEGTYLMVIRRAAGHAGLTAYRYPYLVGRMVEEMMENNVS